MSTPNPFDAVLVQRAQRCEEQAALLPAPEHAHQRRALRREAEILRGIADRSSADRRTTPALSAAP